MKHFTSKEMDALSSDPEVRKHILEFLSMEDSEFLAEVRAHLSPEEMEEYLKEFEPQG